MRIKIRPHRVDVWESSPENMCMDIRYYTGDKETVKKAMYLSDAERLLIVYWMVDMMRNHGWQMGPWFHVWGYSLNALAEGLEGLS